MCRSSPFRSTLNTGYIRALGMCKACTEAIHSVPLWTRVTSELRTCAQSTYILQKVMKRTKNHEFLSAAKCSNNKEQQGTTRNNKEQQGTRRNNKEQQGTTRNNKEQQGTTRNNNKEQQGTTRNKQQPTTRRTSRAISTSTSTTEIQLHQQQQEEHQHQYQHQHQRRKFNCTSADLLAERRRGKERFKEAFKEISVQHIQTTLNRSFEGPIHIDPNIQKDLRPHPSFVFELRKPRCWKNAF